jgi:hypothetical protein
MGRIAAMVRCFALALVVTTGCDRGVEANQDNLSHFATVASDLNRDARELELLAKKVGYVKTKLEQRKSDIAEHAYTEELTKQRNKLIDRLGTAKPVPAPPVEAETPPVEGEVPQPVWEPVVGEALMGAVALHDKLFGPLTVFDTTLSNDNDYTWWVKELGLQSANSTTFDDDPETREPDDLGRAVADCRTAWSTDERTLACTNLLTNHLTIGHFTDVKKQRLSELGSEIERLALIQGQFEAESANRTVSAGKVMDAYGSSFDGLIIWGFPALIIAVLVIVLFEGRRRKGGDAPLPDTLAVVTVLLLVSAIIILGLGGKIQPEALGTLIGGISGYVLGKSAQVLASDKPKDERASAPPTPPAETKAEPEAERKEPTKPGLAAAELPSPEAAVATGKG